MLCILDGAGLTLRGLTLADGKLINSQYSGGACIRFDDGLRLTLNECTIIDNTTVGVGGGIAIFQVGPTAPFQTKAPTFGFAPY